VTAILRDDPHTRYPVIDGDLDHVLGFVHAKDLARDLPQHGVVRREIARRAAMVPGSLTLDRVLDALRAADAQLAVVMDEHGGTAGLLTVEDLFEELVGELGEDAAAKPEIVRLGAEAILADGTARLDEVGEALGLELDHDEVDTVSGLVLDRLGRPPAAGEQVTWSGVEFTVVTVVGNGVGQSRIRRAT
jgi:CBS domain containing-hemolysin-like protein